MENLTEEIERALSAVGWRPGRRVSTSEWQSRLEASGEVTMHERARRFLAEFGGLSFPHAGTGISMARQPFDLDPLLCLGEEGRFAEWSDESGENIFPVGEFDEGRGGFLGIDEKGMLYQVVDTLSRFAEDRAGLECLILGIAPEPLLD
ncbi:SUKH-3 domain-containing protein [Streptomyces bobili]|uniref:SUKH-3 domain-containing protein n=1 Tax=Streptomyces bobili TaxID=67280 RepID=UPI000A3A14B9|nr:SUKH-3 domain-containing protein [Streptomyces bobili]